MPKGYIISLMAANRVGILAAATTAVAELGGDLREVSATVVQKFFTMILAAEFPDHREPQVIVDHIRDVCRPYAIEVCLKDPTQETLQQESPDETSMYSMSLTGRDAPGVLRQITSRLAEEEIDINELYATRTNDDQSAEQDFVIIMEFAVPQGVDDGTLQRDLEDLGKSIGLTATLRRVDLSAASNEPRSLRAWANWQMGQFAAKNDSN